MRLFGSLALSVLLSGCASTERVELAAGGTRSCVRDDAGKVACWGGNVSMGPFGKSYAGSTTPVEVSNLEEPQELCAGQVFACARRRGGRVSCWSSEEAAPAASEIAGAVDATALRCGEAGGCIITAQGGARCWSWVAEGAGSVTDVPSLSQVLNVAVGSEHRCAVKTDGSVWCWGRNSDGQLGIPSSGTTLTEPQQVTGLGSVRAIVAGDEHTCALGDDGKVRCFGSNEVGQLGRAGGSNYVPQDVEGLEGVQRLTAGERHTCAALADGTVKCWGWNRTGQLGDGTDLNRSAPVAVNGLSGVQSVAAGSEHTCAMDAEGEVLCWGNNLAGQLGDGTHDDRNEPGPVLFGE